MCILHAHALGCIPQRSFLKLQQRGPGTGRVPQVTPDPCSGVGLILLLFPMPSAKAADPEALRADWAPLGNARADKRHTAPLSHATWGGKKTCACSQGAVSSATMKAALFHRITEAVISLACVLRLRGGWHPRRAVGISELPCLPLNVRPSGGRAILPGCRKLQATPRLCYKGPLCCELAHHPVKISFHFS